MPPGGKRGFELPDPMVNAVQVGETDLICLLPEQINDVDRFSAIINEEHGPQPALLID